jgi:hypothetical protein
LGIRALTEDLRDQLIKAAAVRGMLNNLRPLWLARPILVAAAAVTVATIASRIADFVVVVGSPDAGPGTQAGGIRFTYVWDDIAILLLPSTGYLTRTGSREYS